MDDDAGGTAVGHEAAAQRTEQGGKHGLGRQHAQERHAGAAVPVFVAKLLALPAGNKDKAVHDSQQHVCPETAAEAAQV